VPGVEKADIAVVVPTFNRPDCVATLLRGLARQTLPAGEFEVIVVDDCSTDDTVARLRALRDELPFRLTVTSTRVNGGPGAARNVGLRATTAEFTAFLDDDCVPEPGWLAAGLDYLQQNPETGVAQGRTRAPDDIDVHRLQGLYVWRVIDAATPYFDACNIFYRRDALAG
jgi:glycosyltransferase involved in cell wall biosynthesis